MNKRNDEDQGETPLVWWLLGLCFWIALGLAILIVPLVLMRR